MNDYSCENILKVCHNYIAYENGLKFGVEIG